MRSPLVAMTGILILLLAVMGGTSCRGPQQAEAPLPPGMPPGGRAQAPEALGGEIRAYIPCGLIIPMRAAIDAFKAKHPQLTVTGIYDNSGIIVKRLAEKKEKADLIVATGYTELNILQKAGVVEAASQQTLGTFELVCIVPTASKLKIEKPADLLQCKTIAMPNPDVNSTGTSGQEALTKLGLWEKLKPKMIMPNHAIDAYTMVAAGKAQAGIAYRNCPLETNPEKLSKSKVRIAFAFPENSYTKQPLLVVLAAQAANRPAAEALRQFMSSPEGRQILAQNGLESCLTMPEMKSTTAPAASANAQTTGTKPTEQAAIKADIEVIAFYPDNEKHKPIKDLVLGLPQKYGPRVKAEFVDFTTDEGFKKWHDEYGLTCGTILINGQQTWTIEEKGRVKEVTFKMAMGGEWTAEDLHAVIKKLFKQKPNQPK